MQGPSKHSTNSSPSPSPSSKRPASPTFNPHPNTDNAAQNSAPPAAPTAGNKGKSLSKTTLRIRRQVMKPANGSPSRAGAAASPDQDLDVPIRELIALGSGQGGSEAKDVDEPVRAGRSKKIKLHLRLKPGEASNSPGSPICLFCLRRFSTRATLLVHLEMEHPSTQEQDDDQTPDHEQGEDNGGGDSGAEKKSEEKEGSSAASEGNDGQHLNKPTEEVQVSAEKNEEKGTSGDETIGGPRKKFRFDLNELPLVDEDKN